MREITNARMVVSLIITVVAIAIAMGSDVRPASADTEIFEIRWEYGHGRPVRIVFSSIGGIVDLPAAERTLVNDGTLGTFTVTVWSDANIVGVSADLTGLDWNNFDYENNKPCGFPLAGGGLVTCTLELGCRANGVLFGPEGDDDEASDKLEIDAFGGVFDDHIKNIGRWNCPAGGGGGGGGGGGEGPSDDPSCFDGLDNDANTLVDATDPGCFPVGGIVELAADTDAPADQSRSSSARDYTALLAVAAAGALALAVVGGWYARRRWQA